jgi:hypothetical protein
MARSVVRELVTLLGFEVEDAKLQDYEKKVESAKKSLRRFAIATGVAAGAVTAIAVKTARAGDNIAKTSRRLGLSVEALQEWRFVAERSGVATATFDMAVQRFGRRAAEAAEDTGEAVDALAFLKVQLRDNEGVLRPVDELLQEALVSLSGIENPIKRNALAMKLFDSEGVRMVQMLESGADGMAALQERARSLGFVMDKETAKISEEAVDAWTDLTGALNGVIFTMGKDLLPLVRDIVKWTSDWIAENRELAAIIGWVALGITGLTAAILGIVTVTKLWAVAVHAVNAAFLLLIGKIALIVGFFALFFLIGEDIGRFLTGGGDTLTGRLVEGAKKFIGDLLSDAWFLIVDTWDRFVAYAKETAMDILPQYIVDLLEEDKDRNRADLGMRNAQTPGTEASAQFMRSAAASIGRTRRGGGVAGDVNVTINQSPGQSSAAVAQDVTDAMLGSGVTLPLNGLEQ